VVGQTYLAIFALMAPLTVAAAWVFLSLESRGVSRDLALGLGGLGCSVLYAFLAARLGSRGYAALALLAVPAAAYGLLSAAGAGIWMGAWLTVLVFIYVAIGQPPARAAARLTLFTWLAEPLIHGAALLSLGWSLGQAATESSAEAASATRPSFQLAVTLGLITIAYAVYYLRSRRARMAWTVWIGITGTVLATVEPLGLGQRGYAIDFAVLAWVYAIGARTMPGRPLQVFVRTGAVVQAAIPILISVTPDGLQAAVLLAGSGAAVFVALDDHQPAWLLAAIGIFTVDWYWLAKSVLPPPAQATADTLILTYSPLPAGLAALGLILRFIHRRWAWPLYAGGGLLAVGVAFAATGQGDLTLAGRALMVYAGIAYVTSALDRWWPGILGALVAATSATLLLLGAASASPEWYPAAMTVVALLVYGGHLAWRATDLNASIATPRWRSPGSRRCRASRSPTSG
jgi:hypothetical protein